MKHVQLAKLEEDWRHLRIKYGDGYATLSMMEQQIIGVEDTIRNCMA